MKPAVRCLLLLCLLSASWLAEAARPGQKDTGRGQWGRKGDGRFSDRDSHHRRKSDYYARADSRTHSRGRRRRRSKSDSRSPARSKKPSEPACKESPGYTEYKRQKQEALAWQERHLQAQALALCLEEREKQKKSAEQADSSAGPAHFTQPTVAEVKAPKARSSVPPMPSKSVPNREPDSDEVSDGDKIPVAILKLVEAELGHTVSFGNKPLTSQSVETRLASAKPPGKSLNAFIVRYGKGKAPPTRNAAKTKMVAALMKELKF